MCKIISMPNTSCSSRILSENDRGVPEQICARPDVLSRTNQRRELRSPSRKCGADQEAADTDRRPRNQRTGRPRASHPTDKRGLRVMGGPAADQRSRQTQANGRWPTGTARKKMLARWPRGPADGETPREPPIGSTGGSHCRHHRRNYHKETNGERAWQGQGGSPLDQRRGHSHPGILPAVAGKEEHQCLEAVGRRTQLGARGTQWGSSTGSTGPPGPQHRTGG